jgi:hypothetical protein
MLVLLKATYPPRRRARSSTVISTNERRQDQPDAEVARNLGEPSGIRTLDPLIKSQVLYRLS